MATGTDITAGDGKVVTAKASFFRPLRNRNYCALFLGQTVSGAGNGMYTVTLPLAVYKLTGSSADMGAVLTANVLPQLAFLIFGGVLADRMSRRRIILGTNTGAGLATLLLCVAAATGHLKLVELISCAFLLGVAASFFGPAFNAMFKDILAPEDLRAGNSLKGMTANINRLISPAIGGALYVVGGAKLGFGIDSATFLCAAGTAALVRVPERATARGKGVLSDARDGFRYLISTHWLLGVVAISLVANTLCIAPMEVLLALVIRQSHLGPWLLGVSVSLQAAVAALGAAVVGKFGNRARPNVALYLLAGVLASGAALVGLHPGIVTILAGMALIGAGYTFSVVEDIVMQRHISTDYLGRIYGFATFASFALLPVGYVCAGFAASRFGAGPVLLCGGILGVAASALLFTLAGRASLFPASEI